MNILTEKIIYEYLAHLDISLAIIGFSSDKFTSTAFVTEISSFEHKVPGVNDDFNGIISARSQAFLI